MQFLQTQGPSGPGWNGGMSLRFCAPKMLCPDQGVTLVMGSGADSPCQGEMARRARGGRVGDYEHEVLIGAVPGGVLFNLPCLPAKPSTAGSPGRGGARERAQFSPSGGNGDKRTLRRRAAMGKGTRRPQAAKSPAKTSRSGAPRSSRPTRMQEKDYFFPCPSRAAKLWLIRSPELWMSWSMDWYKTG